MNIEPPVLRTGIAAEKDRINALLDIQFTKDLRALEMYVGMIGYLKNQISCSAQLSAPLQAAKTDLLTTALDAAGNAREAFTKRIAVSQEDPALVTHLLRRHTGAVHTASLPLAFEPDLANSELLRLNSRASKFVEPGWSMICTLGSHSVSCKFEALASHRLRKSHDRKEDDIDVFGIFPSSQPTCIIQNCD